MDYEAEYYKKVYPGVISDENYYNLLSKLALKRYFSQIGSLKNKKILEFGSGLGKNIFQIRRDEVYGYDLSQFAKKFSRLRGIKIIDNKKDIKDNSFDIILSCHNLEHMDNPIENLRFLRKKLKKGGLLILVLPGEKQGKVMLSPDLNNYHLYSWNFRTINNLLHKTGFKPILNKNYYISGPYRLRFLSKFSMGFYSLITSLAGRIRGSFELFIVAKKF